MCLGQVSLSNLPFWVARSKADPVYRDGLYKELVPNIVLAREFTRHCKSFGLNYIEQIAAGIGGASTDMGMCLLDYLFDLTLTC